jgi:hypothetical protein
VIVGISVEVAVLVGDGVSDAVGVKEGVRVNVWVGIGVCVEVCSGVGLSVADGGFVFVSVFVAIDPKLESSCVMLHAPSNPAMKMERSTIVIRPCTKGFCIAHLHPDG